MIGRKGGEVVDDWGDPLKRYITFWGTPLLTASYFQTMSVPKDVIQGRPHNLTFQTMSQPKDVIEVLDSDEENEVCEEKGTVVTRVVDGVHDLQKVHYHVDGKAVQQQHKLHVGDVEVCVKRNCNVTCFVKSEQRGSECVELRDVVKSAVGVLKEFVSELESFGSGSVGSDCVVRVHDPKKADGDMCWPQCRSTVHKDGACPKYETGGCSAENPNKLAVWDASEFTAASVLRSMLICKQDVLKAFRGWKWKGEGGKKRKFDEME